MSRLVLMLTLITGFFLGIEHANAKLTPKNFTSFSKKINILRDGPSNPFDPRDGIMPSEDALSNEDEEYSNDNDPENNSPSHSYEERE